jgi:ligand-binding sensor domain-containing protein
VIEDRARIAAFILMSWATTASAERLPLTIYTAADGLPHNEINRIVRDSRGFLWFCTGDGLSRFDGYTFTSYTDEDGLPHPTVTDFLETRHHLSELESSRMQAMMDRTSKFISTLSNLLEKISTTQNMLASSLK